VEKAVDSTGCAAIEGAPPDGKAKSHWRRSPPDEAVTTGYAVNETKLTLEAAVVEAASPRSGGVALATKQREREKRVDEAS
jgi:hypothetical protein